MSECMHRYVSGFRKGKPCPYRASFIVNLAYADPFRVCGYHARGYLPGALYPLNWSLAEVRRWQRMNLAALTGDKP